MGEEKMKERANSLKKAIGHKIGLLLNERNIKQKTLAKELGVTDNIISYFVNGARTPNIQQIIKIARLFGVSTDYILGVSLDRGVTDYLLKNGVVCTQCKIGDMAYFVLYDGVLGDWFASEEVIVDVSVKGIYTSGEMDNLEPRDLWTWENDIGKTVFLTKEEAEAALSKLQSSKTDKLRKKEEIQ